MTDSTPDPLGPSILRAYFIAVGDVVEVEVHSTAPYAGEFGPRLFEGEVVDASRRALLIKTTGLSRVTRIPWGAVAAIRDAVSTTRHPAL